MRKTKNFISSYVEHYNNGFVPPKFYIWSAISLVAAALERKVWLPWYGRSNVYPALYVFLVAGPAAGKSSAIRPGHKIIKSLNQSYHNPVRLLPSQMTDAKLLDLLGDVEFFSYKNKQYPHTSAYLIASEGAATFKFKEEHSMVKSLTKLFDPDDFSKALVSREVNIVNPNINILAATTFSDLKKFLDREGILGGFASRCTFVVHKDHVQRKNSWFDETEHKFKDDKFNEVLLHDLIEIHKMVGGFTATQEVKDAWDEWWPKHDAKMAACSSEVQKALLDRKQVILHKLVQIISAAESDSRLITINHWKWALKLVNDVEKDIPDMIRKSQSTNVGSVESIAASVADKLLEKPDSLTRADLMGAMTREGHDPGKLIQSISALSNDPNFMIINGDGTLRLVAKPDL